MFLGEALSQLAPHPPLPENQESRWIARRFFLVFPKRGVKKKDVPPPPASGQGGGQAHPIPTQGRIPPM
jgi:hypothetical protein